MWFGRQSSPSAGGFTIAQFSGIAAMPDRPTKITFGEMELQSSAVQHCHRILLYGLFVSCHRVKSIQLTG
jgi:hypothetical protein